VGEKKRERKRRMLKKERDVEIRRMLRKLKDGKAMG